MSQPTTMLCSATDSPGQLGEIARQQSYHQLLEQARTRRQERVQKNRARLEKKYGKLSDWDIVDILAVEKDWSQCVGCQGLPCKKNNVYREQQRTICKDGYQLSISFKPCEYARIARQQQRFERLFRGAKIPERYLGKTWDDYQVDANNREAVEHVSKGAFLYGERGAGKTFLAALTAQDFLKAGKSVTFIKVPRLLDDLRETYNGKGTYTEAELLEAVYDVDLLVLDDFGMEKPTKFAGATLCKIIDARYDAANLTTIITSNYSLDRIRTELDNATDGKNYNGSRIQDRCLEICKPILLRGTSRRAKQ